MIFQILIRSPDKDMNQAILFGFLTTKEEAEGYCVDLMNDILPKKVVIAGLRVLPAGFILEGAAYGPSLEEVEDAYDFYLKVLH